MSGEATSSDIPFYKIHVPCAHPATSPGSSAHWFPSARFGVEKLIVLLQLFGNIFQLKGISDAMNHSLII